MRKFKTNSSLLQAQIDKAEELTRLTHQGRTLPDKPPTQRGQPISHADAEKVKVLGVLWNSTQDVFVLNFSHFLADVPEAELTKRCVVKVISGYYDPIGFAAPVVIRFKIFLQDLCREGINWDDPLPHNLQLKWHALLSCLTRSLTLTVSRCYSASLHPDTACSLIGFCDASKSAYAAVVYLSIQTNSSTADVQFVACKTRVSPLKEISIPRLELLSALLLSGLISSVQRVLEPELNLDTPCCYGDSEVALYWIKGIGREWKPFVHNRVTQIRSIIAPENWHHYPGTENPANLPSRRVNPEQLCNSKLWIHGPEWLCNLQTPTDVDDHEMPRACEVEEKRCDAHTLTTAITTKDNIGDLIPCQEYSTLKRLLRVTAYVIRAAKYFCSKRSATASNQTTLTSLEIVNVERYGFVKLKVNHSKRRNSNTYKNN